MPVEFALRPRLRLREDSPRPQRSRVRLPRFALPVALYWLVAAGITYAFVHEHDAHPPFASSPADESALAAEPTPRENRPWWRRVPSEPELATPSVAPEVAVTAPAATGSATLDQPVLETAPEPTTQSEPAPAPETVEPRAPSHALVPRVSRSPESPEPARAPDFAPPEPPAVDDAPEAPAPARSPRDDARNNRLPSCEAALESAHQDVDFSQNNGAADLPTSAIAAVLENGVWLTSCGVPTSTSLDVCVAIRGGNVIGVSVVSRPLNSEVTACVRRRASSLQFPYSSHVDIARTRF
jgi:hypothetical protein